MRRLFSLIVSLTVLSAVTSSAQISAEDLSKLDNMLDGYVAALSPEGIDTKSREVDFIIDTSRDSILRNHVSKRLFDYYSQSPIMGDEAVAIHIYDRWFSSGEARFPDRVEETKASMFVQFNRSTLLGCVAPQLHLRGELDEEVILPEAGGRSLIFFYDVDCPKCRMETILLRNFLRDAGEDLTLYAVYVGDDEDAWKKYIASQLNGISDKVKLIHVWDPESISEFQYHYGVTGTPRMFLIDEDGKVSGRRLDTESLMRLLSAQKIQAELDARAPVGSKIVDIKLPGIKMQGGKELMGVWRLRRMDRILFFVPGCSNCEQELDQYRKPAVPDGGRTLLVNLDDLSSRDKELAQKVFDTFDLTVIPYTLVLKNGRIIKKLRWE